VCRIHALVFAIGCASCGYPEFGFTPADAADDTAMPIDVGSDVGDTATAEDAPKGDAALDTASETATDTGSIDTLVSDTFVSDTLVTDTVVTDTVTGFCASSTHAFCNDFDGSATEVTFGWTSSETLGSGAVNLDSTAKSAPSSMRATFTAPSGTTSDEATVYRTLTAPTAGSLTRYEADVMVDAAAYSGVQGTLLMKLQRSGGTGVGVGIDPDGLYVELVGATYFWQQIPLSVAAGSWFHVKVETTMLVSGGTVQVWIDGTLGADLSGKSTVDVEGTSRSIVVGLYGDSPIATFGARYDNVTVDFP
jgi:hypothetical protein